MYIPRYIKTLYISKKSLITMVIPLSDPTRMDMIIISENPKYMIGNLRFVFSVFFLRKSSIIKYKENRITMICSILKDGRLPSLMLGVSIIENMAIYKPNIIVMSHLFLIFFNVNHKNTSHFSQAFYIYLLVCLLLFVVRIFLLFLLKCFFHCSCQYYCTYVP